uniref:ribosomal protein S7 n=1 Tax=Hydnora longicollis TaxID=1778543 RepID=UPI002115521F|nr:ribosomal protein S7 [Hydnora longicollis]USN93661.1 ribosomal protein S7 [Hydnora longicollis]
MPDPRQSRSKFDPNKSRIEKINKLKPDTGYKSDTSNKPSTGYKPNTSYKPRYKKRDIWINPDLRNKPGYKPDTSYKPKPGYKPDTSYKPRYKKRDIWINPDLRNKPGYKPDTSYKPKPGYKPDTSYKPRYKKRDIWINPDLRNKPGYKPDTSYKPKPGYKPDTSYKPKPGYKPDTSYKINYKERPKLELETKTNSKYDPIYKNRIINLLINKNIKNGKKSLSYKIICQTLNIIKSKTQSDPLIIIRKALKKLTPLLILRPKKSKNVNKKTKGKNMRKITVAVAPSFRLLARRLAIHWLVSAAKERSYDRTFIEKLSSELLEVVTNKGNAIRKKDEYMKIAEENKSYVFSKKNLY